jgi:hypothetical protein
MCIILVAMLCVSSGACQRGKPITEKNASQDLNRVEGQVKGQMTSEIEKLQRVFDSLSQRTRDGIVNGDAQEFLADLQQVLAADTAD